MKNNIVFIYSLLLSALSAPILCMDTDLSMDESRIVTPTPEKRGLGVSWTVKSWIKGKPNQLLTDLESGYFDPENSSYHRVFDEGIDSFVESKDSKSLTQALILGTKLYQGKIKPSDIPSCKAHKYLTLVHQEKLDTLNKDVTEINRKHLQMLNELFKKIQGQNAIISSNAQKIITDYKTEQAALIQASCYDIKNSKCALGNLHCVNGTFLLDQNSYCSDYESEEEDGKKAIKNPDNIEEFYNNQHILKKVETDYKNDDTLNQLNQRLAEIHAINKMIHDLAQLVYIDDEQK